MLCIGYHAAIAPNITLKGFIMAYRKTEKVLQQMQSRRDSLVAAAIDVIAKSGIAAFTTDAVAVRAGVAAGLIYKYFPDRNELLAAVVAHLLARDLGIMRNAAQAERDELTALTAALLAHFLSLHRPRLVHAMAHAPAYRLGILTELELLIRAATDIPAKARAVAAAGALGALLSIFDVGTGPKGNAPAAVLFALRGMGISDARARRALDRSAVLA